jgi:hypothetical protein
MQKARLTTAFVIDFVRFIRQHIHHLGLIHATTRVHPRNEMQLTSLESSMQSALAGKQSPFLSHIVLPRHWLVKTVSTRTYFLCFTAAAKSNGLQSYTHRTHPHVQTLYPHIILILSNTHSSMTLADLALATPTAPLVCPPSLVRKATSRNKRPAFLMVRFF